MRRRTALSTKVTKQFCITGGDGTANLPCFPTEDEATTLQDGLKVVDETAQYCVVSSDGKDLGCFLDQAKAQVELQRTGQGELLRIIGTTARLEQREVMSSIPPGGSGYDQLQVTCDNDPTTTAIPDCPAKPEELANQPVVFLGDDGTKYQLSEVKLTGDRIKSARAVYQTPSGGTPGWAVDFTLTGEGATEFGALTTALVGKQLAIVLDSTVISAPTIQSPITGGSGVITGNFTKERAQSLAAVLQAGALPVELERQQVQTVSPTLGKESLDQGIKAAIVGLVLLFLYLLFYYRLLGVVAWLGMSIWAILAVALVSLAGQWFGYSLTLAGVAGLVISLGVTADSYIVFFERLKDEVRGGRSARAAVQPAFKRAYKTIVAADFVTGLAAAILYVTAVSSVRGFALTLGVATALDLFVVWFFKRPTVFLIARNDRLVSLPGFGLTSGVAGRARARRGRSGAGAGGGGRPVNLKHAIATYRGHTVPHFRIIERRRLWFALSGIVIVLSLLGIFVRHFNLSIDFKGGQEITYTFVTPVTADDVQSTLRADGVNDAEVQIVNGTSVSIRGQSLAANTTEADTLLDDLATQAGIDRTDISSTDVGPTWGKEISRKALIGLVVVLVGITLYITFRFEWKMAIGAMVALAHDILITAGVYALTGREVTPETVIAILTILGFSLYDTVVIYDKIKENTESTALVSRYGYAGVVNMSMNQVLMRSVNTSLVVLMPILSLLLIGGSTLKDFAFAMFIGVLTGTYSSIFVAAPVLAVLKEREPRYRQLQERTAAREAIKARRAETASAATPADRRGGRDGHHRGGHPHHGPHRDLPATETEVQAQAPGQAEAQVGHGAGADQGPDPGRAGLPAGGHRLQGHHARAGRPDRLLHPDRPHRRALRPRQRGQGRGHRGPRVHPGLAGRVPLRRRLRARPQAGQAPVGDRRRGVLPRVRDGHAGDPRGRRQPRRAGADRRRRAGDRRHREGDRLARRADRRQGVRHRLPDRARLPEGARAGARTRALHAHPLLIPSFPCPPFPSCETGARRLVRRRRAWTVANRSGPNAEAGCSPGCAPGESAPARESFDALVRNVRSYNAKADLKQFQKAYALAEAAHEGQKRLSGEDFVEHPLAVANILADLRLDTTTLVAALLHDTVEDTEVSARAARGGVRRRGEPHRRRAHEAGRAHLPQP